MLEYTSPNTPQMNGFIERRFFIIKEGELEILINIKMNDTYQKVLWEEAVHTYERVRNSMNTTGSTTSPLKKNMEKNQTSLVHYRSLDVLAMSLNGKSLGSKLQT